MRSRLLLNLLLFFLLAEFGGTPGRIETKNSSKRNPANSQNELSHIELNEQALIDLTKLRKKNNLLIHDVENYETAILELPLNANWNGLNPDELIEYEVNKSYEISSINGKTKNRKELEVLAKYISKNKIFNQICSQIAVSDNIANVAGNLQSNGKISQLSSTSLFLLWNSNISTLTKVSLAHAMLAFDISLKCIVNVKFKLKSRDQKNNIGEINLLLDPAPNTFDGSSSYIGSIDPSLSSSGNFMLLDMRLDKEIDKLKPILKNEANLAYMLSTEDLEESGTLISTDSIGLELSLDGSSKTRACRYKINESEKKLINPKEEFNSELSINSKNNDEEFEVLKVEIFDSPPSCYKTQIIKDEDSSFKYRIKSYCEDQDPLFGLGTECKLQVTLKNKSRGNNIIAVTKTIHLPPRALNFDKSLSFPTGICEVGSSRCYGVEHQVCDKQRKIWLTESEQDKKSAQCGYVTPICNPGEKQCRSGDGYICSFSGGEWLLAETGLSYCEYGYNEAELTITPTATPTTYVSPPVYPTASSRACTPSYSYCKSGTYIKCRSDGSGWNFEYGSYICSETNNDLPHFLSNPATSRIGLVGFSDIRKKLVVDAFDFLLSVAPSYVDYTNSIKRIDFGGETSGSCQKGIVGGFAVNNTEYFTWCTQGAMRESEILAEVSREFIVYHSMLIVHESLHTIGKRHDFEMDYAPCEGTAISQGVAVNAYTCEKSFCYGLRYKAQSDYLNALNYNMGDSPKKFQGKCAQWNLIMNYIK